MSELWSDLPMPVRRRFESTATTLEFKRGDSVYRQGDSPKGVYFVNSGLVGLVKLGLSGKEHLLRFFRTGQFFGHRSLFSSEPHHGSTIALEPSRIELVPLATIHEAARAHPEILFDVVGVLSRELRRCEDMHVMILDNLIDVRVAQALVYLKDLHPDHNWTRQEIANFCASTVSTVIKSLADLEAMGLIRQSGRSIQILNRDRLIALQEG